MLPKVMHLLMNTFALNRDDTFYPAIRGFACTNASDSSLGADCVERQAPVVRCGVNGVWLGVSQLDAPHPVVVAHDEDRLVKTAKSHPDAFRPVFSENLKNRIPVRTNSDVKD
jgi:hypothetical protein